MAYNNYGGGYSRSYNGGGGYSRSNYGGGYSRSYNGGGNRRYNGNGGGQQKKHSGCTYRENVITKSGKRKDAIMYGWNYSRSRGGILKFVGVPAKDTTVKNKSGKDLSKWVVSVQWPNGQKQTMTAFRNRGTGKLTIPDLSMVANPQAPNGGYFGKAFRTN